MKYTSISRSELKLESNHQKSDNKTNFKLQKAGRDLKFLNLHAGTMKPFHKTKAQGNVKPLSLPPI